MTIFDFSSVHDWAPLGNHLWQSTVCVGIAWVLTLALHKNRAAVRYWIWFAASVKFLIPFSPLVAFGGLFAWRTAPVAVQPQWSSAVVNVVQPFFATVSAPQPAVAPHAAFPINGILLGLWLCGAAIGVIFWLRCWRTMRAARRAATPLDLEVPIPVMSSPSQIEPGVFGILRPVLLLPAGIGDRLTREQLDAVVAHEMAHVRRRDNLTAAIHMVVETLLWFFPLLYWLRSRLVEEREQACDEQVLKLGGDPESYAEGIIEVCKSYVESPAACVSGISGSDLKRRIIRIVRGRPALKLTSGKKLLLTAAATSAIIGPLLFGIIAAPILGAQASPAAQASPSYDVTSVKVDPNGDTSKPVRSFEPPNGLAIENMTLDLMIREAYGVRSYQIVGAPGWVGEREYDVEAKLDDAEATKLAVLTKDGQRAERAKLLQSLLADRFKLAVHHETRQGPALALEVTKAGPKFAEAPPDSTKRAIVMGGGNLALNGAPMGTLVTLLSQVMGQTVLDHTGLTGTYALTIPWTPDEFQVTTDNADAAISIFTVLQEKLGLRMASIKAPMDMIVIDHVEEPSPN
jgi:bla regulator protein blaR1